jgi:hypothetical protein
MHSLADEIFLPSKEFTFIITMKFKQRNKLLAPYQIKKLIWNNDSYEHRDPDSSSEGEGG